MDSNSSLSPDIFPFKRMEALPPMIPHRYSDEQKRSNKQGLLRRPYSATDAARMSDILTIESMEPKPIDNFDQQDLEVLEAFRKINQATKDDVYKNVIQKPFVVPCSSPISDAGSDEEKEEQIQEIERENSEELDQDFDDEEDDVIAPFSIKISTHMSKEPNIDKVPCTCNVQKDQCDVPEDQPDTQKYQWEPKLNTSSPNSSPLKLKIFNIPLVPRPQHSGSNSPEAFRKPRSSRPRIKRSKSAQSLYTSHVLGEKKRPVSAQPNVLNLFATTSFKEHIFPVGRQTLQTLNFMNFLRDKQKDMKVEERPSRQQIKSTIMHKENKLSFISTRVKPSLTSSRDSNPNHHNKSAIENTPEKEINQKYRFSFHHSKAEDQSKNGCTNGNCSKKPSPTIVAKSEKMDEKTNEKKLVRPTSRIMRNSQKQQEEKDVEIKVKRVTTKKTRRAQSAPCRRKVDLSEKSNENTNETKTSLPVDQARKSLVPGVNDNSTITMMSLLNSNERPRGRTIKDITYTRVQQAKNARITLGTVSSIGQTKERSSTFNKRELDEYLEKRRESRECSVSKECMDLYSKLKDKNIEVSIDTLRRALMKPTEMN